MIVGVITHHQVSDGSVGIHVHVHVQSESSGELMCPVRT
jgi:hypothetical protein